MANSCHELSPNSPKKCECLCSILKDSFVKCNTSVPEEEDEDEDTLTSDEEKVLVSAVITKYMETRNRGKKTNITSPTSDSKFFRDLFIAAEECNNGDEETEEFESVVTHFAESSSGDDTHSSLEPFLSAENSFSGGSSRRSREDFRRSSPEEVIFQLSECEGWPFGLCRRALFLPPLPKSPSDSWMWCKSAKILINSLIKL